MRHIFLGLMLHYVNAVLSFFGADQFITVAVDIGIVHPLGLDFLANQQV
jgi:hypothetical protein